MKLIFKVHIYLFHPAERPVPESLPVYLNCWIDLALLDHD